MGLRLVTAPAAEPVTVEEAKAHLRVVGSDDDLLISAIIAGARQSAENITGRVLMPQTWELALDGFPHPIARPDRGARSCAVRLPKPPLVSVDSIKYVDAQGVLQTLAPTAYQPDAYSEPANLLPVYGTRWPESRCEPNAVLIRFQAGYPNAASVPQEIKQWILLRIGMLFENRESVAAGVQLSELPHVDRLLDAYKVWSV